jgi:hypothetical protein
VTRDIAYLLRLFDLRSSRLQISHRFMTGVTVEVTAGIGEIRQGELDLRLTRGGSGPADRDGSGPADRADGRSGGGPVYARQGAALEEDGVVQAGPAPEPGLLDRTIAVLQAQLGADGVVRAATAPGRFPEDRFALIPLQNGRDLLAHRPVPGTGVTSLTGELVRVRRIFLGTDRSDPVTSVREGGRTGPGAPPVRESVDRRIAAPPCDEALRVPLPPVRIAGPYLLLSAWWDGPSRRRQYEYRRDTDGRTAWGYRRDGRTPFRLQGYVE